jgi:hypothetical protein
MSTALHALIADLTVNEVRDVNLWVGQGKRYHDVPDFVSNELCRHTSTLTTEMSLLPSPSIPVLRLLNFPTPPITTVLQGIKAEELFSHNTATHTSLECLQLPAPSHGILKSLRACAGQAMLDGKISVRHWDHDGIFLPFNALGTWTLIVEADTAKNAWRDGLRWLDQQHRDEGTSTQYISCVAKLLGALPWKDCTKGLRSWLSITDMAMFLSQDWLSDAHIDSMLSAVVHLRRNTLSQMLPRTEVVLSDFVTHILTSPLLETSPIPSDYVVKAPKSVQRLGSIISECHSSIRVATVSFSPPGHWACLIVDFQARTIGWGDSDGRAAPASLEKRLKAWLVFFSPQIEFSALQALPRSQQTDTYSCGIIAVNTLKHNIFGDKLWSEACRESLRISEFLDILELSESHRETVCSFVYIT